MTDERRLVSREDDPNSIGGGSLTPGGNRIGPKAWRLIVALSAYDDWLGTVLDVVDEAAALPQPATEPALDGHALNPDHLVKAAESSAEVERLREAAELAGGLDAERLAEAIWTAYYAGSSAAPPVMQLGYSVEWYADPLSMAEEIAAAYRHPVVTSPGQDETPRTGEHSS